MTLTCGDIGKYWPSASSGYYKVVGKGGAAYNKYCSIEELHGDNRCGSGGWTRLAYLDMTDATQNCPSGLRLYQSGSYRACGRPAAYSGGCVSVQFPSNGISYSQICGRVTGYQYGEPDAFYHTASQSNINGPYIDGVSITRGSPRQHVWTLTAGKSEATTSSRSCPCNNGSIVSVPAFIGNNYYCESGNTTSSTYTLYTSDPLWDGQGCHSLESPCCNVPGIPWFHRDYGSTTTTDYIELRVCASYRTYHEDIPVSYYEIYVK
uniref:Fibrinogen C-terminal domain-containing protein n=1 Tax=Amphimedon queenslandica TaxID=400682 RepID=A0A1X7SPZ7_AMPQE